MLTRDKAGCSKSTKEANEVQEYSLRKRLQIVNCKNACYNGCNKTTKQSVRRAGSKKEGKQESKLWECLQIKKTKPEANNQLVRMLATGEAREQASKPL